MGAGTADGRQLGVRLCGALLARYLARAVRCPEAYGVVLALPVTPAAQRNLHALGDAIGAAAVGALAGGAVAGRLPHLALDCAREVLGDSSGDGGSEAVADGGAAIDGVAEKDGGAAAVGGAVVAAGTGVVADEAGGAVACEVEMPLEVEMSLCQLR
eukprot:2002502-Prymnesium_polylepis.1